MNFDFVRKISPRALFAAMVIAIALLVITFIWVQWTAPAPPTPGSVVALQTVIPAPTSTPIPLELPTLPALEATTDPNGISIGSYVQITGTQGDGLRIRSAPGLDSEQLFLGYDSEVFIVNDGPVDKDGYIWWYMVAPYDQTRAGWAAARYLATVPPQ